MAKKEVEVKVEKEVVIKKEDAQANTINKSGNVKITEA